MSIEMILAERVTNEVLFELESLFTGDETARTMVVTADILSVVTPPFADTDEGVRLGEFRAWLDSFLEGAEISVAKNPDKKPRDAMLARVHPIEQEFWAIRVTDPDDSPGIRSFGAFAATDKFVALTWEKREVIGDEFDEEVEAVRDAWQDHFGEEQPHFGNTLDAYLSTYNAV